MIDSNNRLLQNIGWRIPSQVTLLVNRDPNTEAVLDQVGQTLLYSDLVLKGVLGTLVVFLLAYYWTQEGNLILRSLLRIMPPQRKKNIREFLQLAETKLGGYVRGQGLLCAAVGATAFIAYLIIGLPSTLVLAIFAGVMEMIPVFGPALGAIPALLVALSIDPGKALWVVIATVVIQLLENAVLVPRIMKHSMGVNPIIILPSLIAFGSVFGFLGALLALPLAAIIQLLVSRVVLIAAENARKAQDKELQIQSLIYESEEFMQTLYENANQNPSFQNLPEADRLELYSLTEELNQFLRQLREDGESA